MIEAILEDRRARFVLVGGAATFVHAIMLAVFVELFGLRPTAGNLLAFLTAFFVSYFGHKRLTFRSDAPHAKALPGFLVAALAGLFVNIGLFAVLTDVFSVNYWIVFGLVILIAPCVVYLMSRDHAFQVEDAGAGRSGAALKWPLYVVPAGLFVVTAIYAVTYYYPMFYFDHWDLVPMMEAMEEGRLQAGQVFALHGRHWHASGYVIMLALGGLTGFSHLAEIIASLLLAVVAFVGALRLVKRQIENLGGARSWVVPTAITALFVFSLDQSQNWLWGWQVAVFAHLVGVVWCLDVLTRDEVTPRHAGLASVFAALAIYGFGTGWALLPIGFVILAARKVMIEGEGWGGLVVWAVFGALISWHMSLALQAQDASGASSAGLGQSMLAYGLYAMNYVANAVTRFSIDIALPVFVLSAGIAVWCMYAASRGRGIQPLKLAPALALMAYAIGAGLLTSFGRLEAFGANTAFLGRYITFANMYWIGVIGLVLGCIPLMGKRGRRGLIMYAGVICLMKLGTIGNVVGSSVPHTQTVRGVIAKVRACYPNVEEADLAGLFGPGQMTRADERLAYLQARDLGAFSSPARTDIVCSQASSGASVK